MFTQIIKNPQVESARKHYTKPGNPIVGALSIDQICLTATNPFFVNRRPVQCPHLQVRKALLRRLLKKMKISDKLIKDMLSHFHTCETKLDLFNLMIRVNFYQAIFETVSQHYAIIAGR